MVSRILNAVQSLRSIHVRNQDHWLGLHEVRSLVFVGSSCAGKSTIVDAIREALAIEKLDVLIPARFVTRPPRQADNLVENRHVTPDEFREKVARGEIGLRWVRKMEGGRSEEYGFQSVPNGSLALYSGNNALYNNPDSVCPSGVLNGSLFIGVFAPDSVRRERLIRRSPDLVKRRPEEVAYRLGDSSNNILPHVHLVVQNYGHFEKIASGEMVCLLKAIVEARRLAVVPS